MIFFPAIDLKGGQCVRLLRGDMNKVTVFNDDAVAQGKAFASSGCEWIHVVDLNGAFEGKPVNGAAVKSILEAINIPVQLGGGIRDMKTIAYWQEVGIARVILGTVALRDPNLVQRACKEFPGQVAVGIDAQDGLVAVEGWSEISEMKALDLALKFEDSGVAVIGMPSIESQGYASPASKEGHINCQSGAQLQSTLLGHFTNCFMFSMNDEVVHTGFQPMAHYLLALCVGPRR